MDMRKPTLHQKFGLQNGTLGISTLLSDESELDEVISTTPYENLDVILSGPKAPNTTRLIMSEKFDKVLKALSGKYHYILIDTPPIGIVSDAMKIMHHSDMVLFLMKAEYSKQSFLTQINQYSRYENLNIGIVLNGVDYEKSYYYHEYHNQYMENYYQRIEEI
jgi:capsular exopolysaccharide synthesis family protein